ncbi:MAG: prepilin-type N-terminal cleavage/methylation domain-containing protein [Cyanobacteria bacterium]|nr:prepilin-type N-terminal cleavage/methylation domain-containing protein [Cyanobacteriota bacterium]MDW8200161.1 prepilin-type N-terminal cleavage/methylation domain-containing protein [Cyanobacteriota bacterium SKYGB_h_bin112]
MNRKQEVVQQAPPHDAGYTLVEVLVVVVMIGVMVAIAVPGWVAFRNRFALSSAQVKVAAVLKRAQNEAKLLKTKRQASFRMQGKLVQYTVHDASVPPTSPSLPWYDLGTGVRIDPHNTTMHDPVPDTIWRMQFDYDGTANGQIGRLTLVTPERPDQSQQEARNNNRPRRCVFVSNLLGALREDRDQGCVVR